MTSVLAIYVRHLAFHLHSAKVAVQEGEGKNDLCLVYEPEEERQTLVITLLFLLDFQVLFYHVSVFAK